MERQKDIAVCFPFKKEDIDDFIRNIKEVLLHERVSDIILVGYNKNETYHGIEEFINTLDVGRKSKIHLLIQRSLGNKRPGKGDGMNTAIEYFLENTDAEFLHFYDADIKSFTKSWIDRVQNRLDEEYDVARCFFPRAYTDAMVTWNITRVGFAYVWPFTILPDIEQPLGGELGINRKTAEKLRNDKMVLSSSDWSIDTAFTVAFARYGVKLYEVYIREGKHHKLYGKLSDLKTMAVECFDIIRENKSFTINTDSMVYKKDEIEKAPDEYKRRIAFDMEGTIKEFKQGWTPEMRNIIEEYLPAHIAKRVLIAVDDDNYKFMTAHLWFEVYDVLMKHFYVKEDAWKGVLFKLWVLRVLNHAEIALENPDVSLIKLKEMVDFFRKRRAKAISAE